MEDYESVLLVKHEVFVFRVPPRATNRGYRAADWSLQQPDWTGRMRLVTKAKDCILKLEDKNSGELFAKCPIDKYPGIAIEPVVDSSRYFVIRIQDDDGRAAFIGLGFSDRGDSFDLNVALQDHFKWVQKTEEIEQETTDEGGSKPQLDLSFKEGQTITIQIGQKAAGSSRPKPKAGGQSGILPPPPGGIKIAPPPGSKASPVVSPVHQPNAISAVSNSAAVSGTTHSNVDLLGNLDDLMSTTATQAASNSVKTVTDLWGDFASAGENKQSSEAAPRQTSGGGSWVQF